jgi:hypothetical protein
LITVTMARSPTLRTITGAVGSSPRSGAPTQVSFGPAASTAGCHQRRVRRIGDGFDGARAIDKRGPGRWRRGGRGVDDGAGADAPSALCARLVTPALAPMAMARLAFTRSAMRPAAEDCAAMMVSGGIVMMRANLRGDRREERGDEHQHKHDEGLVALYGAAPCGASYVLSFDTSIPRPPRIAVRNPEESEL